MSPKGKVLLIPYIWGEQQSKPSLQRATLAPDVTHKYENRDRKERAACALCFSPHWLSVCASFLSPLGKKEDLRQTRD